MSAPAPPPAPNAGESVPLEALEEELGYRYRDRDLLRTSLTHSSYAHETALDSEQPSNERLEFLGDAVFGMVVAHLLYEAHPSWREGDLTRALHRLVDRRGLARLAKQLGLGAHLRLGRTELRSNGRRKDSILADGMGGRLYGEVASEMAGWGEPCPRTAIPTTAERPGMSGTSTPASAMRTSSCAGLEMNGAGSARCPVLAF